jgi:hypothetical protein
MKIDTRDAAPADIRELNTEEADGVFGAFAFIWPGMLVLSINEGGACANARIPLVGTVGGCVEW